MISAHWITEYYFDSVDSVDQQKRISESSCKQNVEKCSLSFHSLDENNILKIIPVAEEKDSYPESYPDSHPESYPELYTVNFRNNLLKYKNRRIRVKSLADEVIVKRPPRDYCHPFSWPPLPSSITERHMFCNGDELKTWWWRQ